jgi:hypothetical protein
MVVLSDDGGNLCVKRPYNLIGFRPSLTAFDKFMNKPPSRQETKSKKSTESYDGVDLSVKRPSSLIGLRPSLTAFKKLVNKPPSRQETKGKKPIDTDQCPKIEVFRSWNSLTSSHESKSNHPTEASRLSVPSTMRPTDQSHLEEKK